MTKRWMISTAVVLAGAMALGGCYYGADGLGGEDDTPTAAAPRGTTGSTGSTGSDVTVGTAEQFAGDLGTVTNFAVPGAELRVTQSSTYASARIDAENTSARWWAMTALTITGGLNHPSLQPGTRLRFTNGRAPADSNGLRVSVLGCSGPRRDNFTYDSTATNVEVEVEPGPTPDTRRMVFDAEFAGPRGPQTVRGSFVYDPR